MVLRLENDSVSKRHTFNFSNTILAKKNLPEKTPTVGQGKTTVKQMPQQLPKEQQWTIRRDMTRVPEDGKKQRRR